MLLVCFLLRFGPLGAHFLALFVRRVGELVFHAATEFMDAFWMLLCGAGRQIVRDVVVVLFIIAVGGDDIVVRRDAVEALDPGALLWGEAGHVLFVIVGVMPNGAGWLDVCVDEELVMGFWVVLSYPAGRQWAGFVFHASSRVWRDAIFYFEVTF